MPRVLTDFNDVDAAGAVTALASHIEGRWNVIVGNRVLLTDDGEHEAWGRVVEIANDLITVEVDWETWGPAGRYRVTELGDWSVGMMWNPPSPLSIGTIALGGLNLPTTPSATRSAVASNDLQPA